LHISREEREGGEGEKAFYLDFSSRSSRDTPNFLFINRFAGIFTFPLGVLPCRRP
jgi:hypothetical protein